MFCSIIRLYYSLEFASIIHPVHEISMFEKGRNTQSIVLRFCFQAYHLRKIFLIYSTPNKYRIRIIVKGKKAENTTYCWGRICTLRSYVSNNFIVYVPPILPFTTNKLFTLVQLLDSMVPAPPLPTEACLCWRSCLHSRLSFLHTPDHLTSLLASAVWLKIIRLRRERQRIVGKDGRHERRESRRSKRRTKSPSVDDEIRRRRGTIQHHAKSIFINLKISIFSILFIY